MTAGTTTRSTGAALDVKLAALESHLTSLGRVVVAFSGGVDSTFLAVAATKALGTDRCHAVTAVSPSLAGAESRACEVLAGEWGLRWTTVCTDEMERAAYRVNDPDRCWHCKDALMDQLVPVARAERARVVLGVNLDDLSDHRPGQEAAARRNAVFPLVEAGFTKSDIREASRQWGIAIWDKPASACLASRVPYGTPVNVAVLSRVERAESGLRALGFGGSLRVRHGDDAARIEVQPEAMHEVLQRREEVVAAVRAAGYRFVALDLEGFRSGSLNRVLDGS